MSASNAVIGSAHSRPMADFSQIASGARDSIGRYFSLVSVVPSAFLVAWTALLVRSGAWSGTPDVGAALGVFAEAGIGGAAGLVLATIVLGVVLHPMQFAFVQFLEGYWGATPVAREVRRMRTYAHWDSVHSLRVERAALGRQLQAKKAQTVAVEGVARQLLMAEIAELRSTRRELGRIEQSYPDSREAFMPTRLGNILRRFEWSIGVGYGIETITATPYLMSVSTPSDLEYLDDQRSQLDLAVRMTVVSLLATALGGLFLARHGMWLLVVLVPYVAGYLSYRGAVVAASEYGRALGVLVTLNRFALYERLQLKRPKDTDEELKQNENLMHYLRHGDTKGLVLTYRDPPPSD
jgi:hypothetical protein